MLIPLKIFIYKIFKPDCTKFGILEFSVYIMSIESF
jgi:hypothetical protein